jgi:hypothetical protein
MRKSLSVLGLTVGLVILAQPVMAEILEREIWGPEPTYYDGIKRATGSGELRNDGKVRAVNRIQVVDDARDGNKVYGVTEFLFHQYDCERDLSKDTGQDCREDFHSKGTRSTEEFKNDTRTYEHRMDLEPNGFRVRAKTFACVQMGWPVPDGCAAAAYPDFDY